MPKTGPVVLFVVLLTIPAPASFATMPGDVPDKVRFSLGGMAADAFTEAALSSTSAGVGATINFEDVFDLPTSKTVARATGYWHFSDRQYLDFGYVDIDRSGRNILDEDVEWGDYVFLANGQVDAGFRTQFPYAAWRWGFLQLDQVRISGSAGISYLGLSATLKATGNVTDPDGNPISGTVEKEASIDFPVPLIGLQIDWAVHRKLMIEIYKRAIYIDAFDLRGGIDESAVRLHWYFSKHLGISGGLDRESIDIKEYRSGDATARFRYEVSGLALYLDFAF